MRCERQDISPHFPSRARSTASADSQLQLLCRYTVWMDLDNLMSKYGQVGSGNPYNIFKKETQHTSWKVIYLCFFFRVIMSKLAKLGTSSSTLQQTAAMQAAPCKLQLSTMMLWAKWENQPHYHNLMLLIYSPSSFNIWKWKTHYT